MSALARPRTPEGTAGGYDRHVKKPVVVFELISAVAELAATRVE